jgi:short-subunit dehydrogenase
MLLPDALYMFSKTKPIDQQCIVITGSTSGIGRVTARMALERGAAVVINARSEEECEDVARELKAISNRVEWVAGDVADEETHKKLLEKARERFNGVDTWVNNAGVSIYGRFEKVPVEDMKKLFDTNLWGLVHGCKTAIEAMRSSGGVIINIGSTLSDRSIPLQGIYCASKQAVKGLTDSVRMEVERDNLPIAMVLVKPGSIDTLYPEHAKNYMDHKPTLPPPVYGPEVVARVILHAAEHPKRERYAGGGGRAIGMMEKLAPRAGDHLMEWSMFDPQSTDERALPSRRDALHEPTRAAERGELKGRRRSVYSTAGRHPVATAGAVTLATAAVAGFAAAALIKNWDPSKSWDTVKGWAR